MKFLFLTFTFFAHAAFAQLQHGTTTEEILAQGFYGTGFIKQNSVGPCSLPMVTRGEEFNLVNHHLIVNMPYTPSMETAERIYLKTTDQFEYNDCTLHRQDIIESIASQSSPFLVTLSYTDKVITNRGSYMRLSYCNKVQIRTIEASVNRVRYSTSIKIAENNCN